MYTLRISLTCMVLESGCKSLLLIIDCESYYVITHLLVNVYVMLVVHEVVGLGKTSRIYLSLLFEFYLMLTMIR